MSYVLLQSTRGVTKSISRKSAEFLRESDQKLLRAADVAEPIRVFILGYFAYELRTARAEPLEWDIAGEYDVAPTGEFYSMQAAPGAAEQTSIQLKTGWFAEVDRLVRPTAR